MQKRSLLLIVLLASLVFAPFVFALDDPRLPTPTPKGPPKEGSGQTSTGGGTSGGSSGGSESTTTGGSGSSSSTGSTGTATGGGGSNSATSNVVCTKIGSPPGGLPSECSSGGNIGQTVVELGRKHLKTGTYVWATPSGGGTSRWSSYNPSTNPPKNFDCSGYAGWIWYWGSGGKVSMNGQTNQDWNDSAGNSGTTYQKFLAKDRAQLQPGDLVYFGSDIHHVGVYEGQGECKKNDCYLNYYTSGLPGASFSLSDSSDFYGFMRPVIK